MYHYIESGLNTIWLANGVHQSEIEGEIYISIEDVTGLHRSIARALVACERPLQADEIRFLRVEMNMSQKALADLLGVDVQTVARWEKAQSSLPRMTDVMLRMLYLESVNESSRVGACLRMLAQAGVANSMDKLVFEERNHAWRRSS
ncbi:helix-turn-helix domain-containing protein [Serratia rhizosphaerae]|uniref:Helix-turn-helix domain-containing protein n=1 Tax=Serratia rhizosphaerae TaxID=2597702 RepID=A0ABX6GKC6_9GAMM|nr:helix-turn-helix domain-containing protein [Serratia rhizosphaerae]QHA86730.1 helix-turn-helix domain-containing protein [Serratia rhizosphaerae]